MKRRGKDAGFPLRTLQRAMGAAGVESLRGGFGQAATWSLSDARSITPSKAVAPTQFDGVTEGFGATGPTELEATSI